MVPIQPSCEDWPRLRAGLGLEVVNELSVSLRVADLPDVLRTLRLSTGAGGRAPWPAPSEPRW